jgi:BirA family transcriptional regulator, biotin operon repressor / biotin---[acetyl-CoA-carboxylase] ligase
MIDIAGLRVLRLVETGSTNTELLARARAGDTTPTLLVADRQTAGRGRMGRAWVSAPGASLTFSLMRPLAPQPAGLGGAGWDGLSLALGLALAEAIEPGGAAGGGANRPRIGLKWPNDLWLLPPGALAAGGSAANGRKLGGILIETVGIGHQEPRVAVIGVGLNIAPLAVADTGVLPYGLACLQELEPEMTAEAALAGVAPALWQALTDFETHGFAPLAEAYAARDLLRGQPVQAQGENWLAEGVDARGVLRLSQGRRELLLSSGEVSVRPLAHTEPV